MNMKKIILVGTAALATLSSTAAFADTQSATATVKILAAVKLTKVADLDFGTVAASTAGGTVVLDETSATAARTCTGVVCSGTAARAKFSVTQATNGSVLAITNSPSVTLNGPVGSTAMTATLARSASTITYSTAVGATNDVFYGGTLTVGANQAAGTYTGSFNVTVDYQ
jgi:Mat/Ecp fimbriae major subunit